MADRVLAGAAPPADAAKWTPGTVWVQILQREADATGKTIKVNIWSTNMCNYVGVNFAGPGREQHGGPWLVEVHPTDWTTAPAAGAPGLVNTADMVLPVPQFYRVEVQCSDVRTHLDVQVGKPGVEQMGPYVNSDLAWEKTPQGRQEVRNREIRDMARPSPILGRPRRSRTRRIVR